jgi:branched-chain amino acid transport system permease protein
MVVLGPILETLIGGLLTGVLYSLVALGFVLIFKASGVFNFAQGAMVLFAALTLARLAEVMPMVLAIALTVAIMIALAYAIELLVLRHLVNQEGIILFMATLGVANFLDGFGQTLWGSDIYKIDLGLPRDPIFLFESVFPGGLLVDPTELIAAVICAVLVAVLAVFFQVTRIGRALRAVADDHQAAQSVGIPLDYIWLIVWAVAGIVALVGGMMWGVKLGVQFSLAQIALKALPVLILGGFTSIPGAIVGGLIIGAGEKLAEVLLGPVLIRTFDLAGGGIENWFAYMLALLFLLFRPQGLFGEKIIERV